MRWLYKIISEGFDARLYLKHCISFTRNDNGEDRSVVNRQHWLFTINKNEFFSILRCL